MFSRNVEEGTGGENEDCSRIKETHKKLTSNEKVQAQSLSSLIKITFICLFAPTTGSKTS